VPPEDLVIELGDDIDHAQVLQTGGQEEEDMEEE
jgi:hypothetical protein